MKNVLKTYVTVSGSSESVFNAPEGWEKTIYNEYRGKYCGLDARNNWGCTRDSPYQFI